MPAAFLLAWTLLLGAPSAADEPREAATAGQLAPETVAHGERASRFSRAVAVLRERIAGRPPEERARLERHLQELETLSPQARERLLRRARALRDQEQRIDPPAEEKGAEESAPEVRTPPAPPPEPKAEAEDREPRAEGRREQQRKRLRESLRKAGSELRERLPEELRQKLEKARPEQRRRLLERLYQHRERYSQKAIEAMRQRYGLAPREVRRLEGLPLEQRLEALHELEGTRRGRRRP